MATMIAKRPDLARALLQVKGGWRAHHRRPTAPPSLASSQAGSPPRSKDLPTYINQLRRRRSAATVNQALAAGRKAFLQAGERLGLPAREISLIRGALAEIPAVKKAPPEVAVVSPEERLRLFAALPLRVRLVAETLYVTGARVSEILGVRRDQVKTNGAVELRLYGKGGKERSSRIPRSSTSESLQSSPMAPTYLSPTRGSTSTVSTSRGRSRGRHGGCSVDLSRRTCCGTHGRQTFWRRHTGSRRSRGCSDTRMKRPRCTTTCGMRSATRSCLAGCRKTRQGFGESILGPPRAGFLAFEHCLTVNDRSLCPIMYRWVPASSYT